MFLTFYVFALEHIIEKRYGNALQGGYSGYPGLLGNIERCELPTLVTRDKQVTRSNQVTKVTVTRF